MRLTSDVVVKRLFCFRDIVVCTQLQQTVEAGGKRDAHDPLFLFDRFQVLGLLAGFVQPQKRFVRVVDQSQFVGIRLLVVRHMLAAEILGISQVQVSRLKKKLLAKIKREIG